MTNYIHSSGLYQTHHHKHYVDYCSILFVYPRKQDSSSIEFLKIEVSDIKSQNFALLDVMLFL